MVDRGNSSFYGILEVLDIPSKTAVHPALARGFA
jgi:hypothetical protein